MALDADRRAGLFEHRARSLAARFVARDAAQVRHLPGVVIIHDDEASVAYAYDGDARSIGGLFVWARSRATGRVRLIVDDAADPGRQAARAALLRTPIDVLAVSGAADLSPVRPTPIDPPVASGLDPDAVEAMAARAAEFGATLVDDHGTIVVELLGLEVGDIVTDDERGARLRPGVGAVDREATRVLHSGVDPWVTFGRITDEVQRHRRAGGDGTHPLATMARERWLAQAVARGLGGDVDVLAPIEPRRSMRVDEPGIARSGDHLVVGVVGGDVSLPAVVADHLIRDQPSRVLVAVPTGRAIPTVHDLEPLFQLPVELEVVSPPWAGG